MLGQNKPVWRFFGSSDFYALPRQFKFLFRHCTMHCYVETKATETLEFTFLLLKFHLILEYNTVGLLS